MTIERFQQIFQSIESSPWHLLALFLLVGVAGIFIPYLHFFTTISLLLSIGVIPGFTLIYQADRPLVINNPIITLAGTVLISITMLTIYLLMCEIMEVPMTVSSGSSSQAGIVFQTGILLYSLICVLITIRGFHHSPPKIQPQFLFKCMNKKLVVPFLCTIVIFFGIAILAGIILTTDTPEPTTELFFSQAPGYPEMGTRVTEPISEVTIVNHERRPVVYTLTSEIFGKEQTRIQVNLKDGESFTAGIIGNNEIGREMNETAIRVCLYDDRSQKSPYREIWRR